MVTKGGHLFEKNESFISSSNVYHDIVIGYI